MDDVTNLNTDGERHGPHQEFWSNGMLKYQGEFVKDSMEGLHIKYFESGILDSYVNYKNDERHGYTLEFWDSGVLAWECQYTNGMCQGLRIDHNEKGNVIDQYTFINNIRVGYGFKIKYEGDLETIRHIEKTYYIL